MDDRVPLLLRHVDQDPVTQDAGVVDQHMEIAEGLDGGVDEPLAALPVADVVGVGHRLAAGRPDLVDHLLGRRAIVARAVHRTAEVVDHDPGTLGSEEQCVLTPDAPSCPGDDGDPSLQCSHVLGSPSSAARSTLAGQACSGQTVRGTVGALCRRDEDGAEAPSSSVRLARLPRGVASALVRSGVRGGGNLPGGDLQRGHRVGARGQQRPGCKNRPRVGRVGLPAVGAEERTRTR